MGNNGSICPPGGAVCGLRLINRRFESSIFLILEQIERISNPDLFQAIRNRKVFSLDRRGAFTDAEIETKAEEIKGDSPDLSNDPELVEKLKLLQAELLSLYGEIDPLSGDYANLLVPKREDGTISFECVREISLKLSVISGALSTVALSQDQQPDEQEQSIEKLTEAIKALLVEILINC